MKASIRTIAVGFLLFSFSIQSFSQASSKAKASKVSKSHKIEKSKVPAVVTESYISEYPMSAEEGWYGYPAFSYPYDWYNYNPYLYTKESPEYYIVEFTHETVPHKVIYSKVGKKIATHRKLNGALPVAVSSAINQGVYKAWTLKSEKEEIFKDGDADILKVYKVVVEKGKNKHLLFYQADGKLLKDKEV